ncbi:MAG: ankyrin repeat domain-containing protein [Pedobacter sp.]|nr:MAG: ankyrin repeat domain-containing protein [Pedobacter sp.]
MKLILTLTFSLLSYIGYAQTATPNIKDAFKADDYEILAKELKAEKLTVNDCLDVEGSSYSFFALAIRMDKTKIFDSLIANKADLEKTCADKTPLMYASKYGKLEMAIALIKAGANLKATNKEGKTALDYAKRYKMSDLEAYLLTLSTK